MRTLYGKKYSEKSICPIGPFIYQGEISVAADFPTLAEVKDGWVYVVVDDVTDNDPTKTNTGQFFPKGSIIAWKFGSPNKWTDITGFEVWIDTGTEVKLITAKDVNFQGFGLKDANVTTAIKIGDSLNTFFNTTNKTIVGAVNELNVYQNKIDKDVSYFLNTPATQTLTTSGAGDLATKIGTLVDGDILEIQVDASYSQIIIPSGKRFAIRVKKGFHVQLNTAQAITLNNGAANIFLSGFIFDSNPGGDANNRGSAVCFQHQAQVQDITFHNCTFRNNADSAVLLSYHQSTGGDTYYTANLLSEFSDRIAFTDCHFFSAANDPNEGGAITARGINFFYIKDCSYNGQELARQIHLQNCRDSFIVNTEAQHGGGGGNGEGIKIDKIGSPTYRNSAFIKNCRVKDCIEGIDVDDSADVVIIDSVVHGCSAEGISVDDTGRATIINCVTYNNADGIRQETGGIIELKGCNSFNNTNLDYRMDGGYTPDASNISDPDQTFFNWVNFPVIQKEPTGFTEPENIIVTYDSVARTITLTGTINGYYRGKRVPALTIGWVSPAHSVVIGKYWLAYNDSGFQWVADGNQKLYDLLIAFVNYGVFDKWGQRECHGLMPWQSHLETHDTIGTYKTSGGTLFAYILNSTTIADRQPSINAAIIKDEDLETTNPALTASINYTQFYLSSIGTANFNKTATDIVPVSGNQPYWNQFTGSTWQQTLMSNNFYMSIWLVAIPVSTDAESQDYRFVWVQGQDESLTIIEQQALDPNDVNLGELITLTPELVFIAQVIIRYQAANWTFSEVRTIQGTKFSQTSSPQGNFLSVVTSDASLTGLGTVASPLSVVGGSEDFWHRDTVGTPFLRPENIGDDVNLGVGNLDALNISAISGPDVTGLAPGFLLIRKASTVISADNIFAQIANWNSAASMIGTGTSIQIQQKGEGTTLQDMGYMTWRTETNWGLVPSTRNGAFDFYLTRRGIKLKVYTIRTDPVYISDHLFEIQGNLVINQNSASPVHISNGHLADRIFMLSGSTIFSVNTSCNVDQNISTVSSPSWFSVTHFPRIVAPSTADGTVYYNNAIATHYYDFRANGRDIELSSPAADQFKITTGTIDFNVLADCTLDQDLISSGNPTWNTLLLTETNPTFGLTVSLAFPDVATETGIGVNIGNKLIYNNPEGMGIYSTHDIMFMLDSNNTSSNAAFRIRKDSYSYTGGTELFTFLETARLGINEVNPAAMLHIDQSSTTAAIPVLTLDQADTSEPVLNLIAQDKGVVPTSTVDSIRSIRVIHNGVNVGVIAIHANQGPA